MNVNEKLNSKNVAELRKLAACYGIAGRSTMKKAELIDKLIDAGVETCLAIDEITPEQQARYAEQYNAAKAKTDVVGDAVTAMIDQDAPERIRFDADDEAAYIEEGLQADAEAGTYSFVNEVAVLRDAPGTAIVTAAFDGRTVGGFIVREGKRLVLTTRTMTITGNSYEKIAKRFAKRLGFHADVIDVARGF